MILNKEAKAKMLAELIEKIKKELNIEVILPTVSGISVRVRNDSEEFCYLRYNETNGFEISSVGGWFSPKNAVAYATKLLNLSAVAVKLNMLYKPL